MKRKFISRKKLGENPQTETKAPAGEKAASENLGPDLPGCYHHNLIRLYKVDIHSCPVRNLLPVQVWM